MLSTVGLGGGPGFTLTAVTCVDDHTSWSSTEVNDDYRIVLVRRGRFRRLADGVAADVDPTLAYLGTPGEEERFAHPSGGDECTSLSLTPALWRTLAGESARPSRSDTLYLDARLDLAHRRLLAASRSGDSGFALAEELLTLLATALHQTSRAQTGSTGFRLLVRAAREAIDHGHPAAEGLFPLAELLGASPYQLSRAFTRELGVSLTHYRNRVRVGRALDRLEEGEPNLAILAADLGFADQAHLTRTVRRHLGHTPTALRRLLRA